jgi:hypothetical protein
MRGLEAVGPHNPARIRADVRPEANTSSGNSMTFVHKLFATAFTAACLTQGALAADAAASAPAAKAAVVAVAQACKSEIETLCPGMKAGDGKLGPCLKAHAAKIGAECKAAVKAQRDGAKAGS